MEHFLEHVKSQAGVLVPAFSGVVVTLITSERHSFLVALARVACGLFCAIYFTEPVISWMDWETESYRSAVAGLLAMNGFQLVRFFTSATPQSIIQMLRGKKDD